MKLSDAQWALWLRMPRLSAEEALALSYGLDPEVPGPVPGDYTLRRKLFMRSFAQLPGPKEFAKWAQEQDFNIPLPLAKLDLQEWSQPDLAPDELIEATLTPLVMPGTVQAVRGELARLGHRVVVVAGIAHLHIADGSWKGRIACVDRSTLVGLCVSGSRLGEWLPSSGASGSGATASAGNLSFTPAPVFSESPHLPTDKTAETSDAGNPATMKRAALVNEYEKVWPSIDRDLRDASENGLSDAAKTSERGWWRVDAALQWAKQRGKLNEVPRTSPATSVFDLAGRKHRI